MDALDLRLRVPLRDFPLDLGLRVEGGPVALVGPSGAGKSTVLRAVAGLVAVERGHVTVGGTPWLDTERGIRLLPEEREVGYLFQDAALFPHMSVRANVAFGGRARADELLERLGIDHLAAARPGELSGGERQRVALARALARAPRVLLLDEPTASLDARTRATVRAELAAAIAEAGVPAIVVTHDLGEAAALAPEVAVLVEGSIRQTGTPAGLVAAPADPFVASLTGASVLAGTARPGPEGLTVVALAAGGEVRSTDPARGPVAVAVHPWEVAVEPPGPPGPGSALNRVGGVVTMVHPIGNRVRVSIGPLVAEVTAESARRLGLAPGREAVATFKASGTRLVPEAPGEGGA